ncbi:MAG TPA: hypothetical protein VN688_18190 [Gemmataceae bacterium]|nr:hypothetical protein [Gemmataceae bacterium]
MHHHRFLDLEEFAPLPAVATPSPASAFLVCPLVLSQGGMGLPCPWQQIYQLAYERAQAVVRPSRLERLQAVSWN